jgi:hypothetical protein
MMDRAKRSDKVFADYEWMEKMDEFDRQIEAEMWEEELIRCCIEQLLDEEEEIETLTAAEILQQQMEKTTLNGRNGESQRPVNGNVLSTNLRNGYTSSLSVSILATFDV